MDVCFFAGLVPPVFVVAVPSLHYVSFLSALPVRRRPFRPPFLDGSAQCWSLHSLLTFWDVSNITAVAAEETQETPKKERILEEL